VKRVLALVLSIALMGCVAGAFADVAVPPPLMDESLAKSSGRATAVLAGGCFWGVQLVFQHVRGVTRATSGFANGAESVEIEYDPSKVTYGQLLHVFFAVVHDPTQLDRQGPDVGKEYRSAIFVSTDSQTRIARAYVEQLNQGKIFGKPVVTEVTKLPRFSPADASHQDYATRNPDDVYIRMYDAPKLERLKAVFPGLYEEKKASASDVRARGLQDFLVGRLNECDRDKLRQVDGGHRAIGGGKRAALAAAAADVRRQTPGDSILNLREIERVLGRSVLGERQALAGFTGHAAHDHAMRAHAVLAAEHQDLFREHQMQPEAADVGRQ